MLTRVLAVALVAAAAVSAASVDLSTLGARNLMLRSQLTAEPAAERRQASGFAALEEPPLQILMEKYDDNSDGQLSDGEFDKLYEALFGEDEHAGHNHATAQKQEVATEAAGDETVAAGRRQDDHSGHDHGSGDENCHPADELFGDNDGNGDGALNMTELEAVSPALVQMVLDECKDSHSDECTPLEPGFVWLAALLSGLVMSLISLCVVALFPVSQMDSMMNLMLAFAVGALVGDAVLHLIPSALGVHVHGEEAEAAAEESEKAFLGPAFMVLMGILVFFIMERQLSHFHNHSHSHGGEERLHGGDDDEKAQPSKPAPQPKKKKGDSATSSSQTSTSGVFEMNSSSDDDDDSDDSDSLGKPTAAGGAEEEGPWYRRLAYQPLGYMSLVADGLHNFTDGVALGVAFTLSFSSGIATSIAVFCHELPQELGEFAILLRAGFPKWRAVMWNFISGLTNLLGVIIGVAIGTGLGTAGKYISAFIAGGFLYIALSDMVAELLEEKGWRATFGQSCAIVFGFLIMLVIALWLEEISIGC